MIWNFAGAALLISFGKVLKRKLKSGSEFVLYVMWYTAGRMWIESLRIDFSHTFLGVRINVWVSIVIFIISIIVFMILQNTHKSRTDLVNRLIDITADERERESQSNSNIKTKRLS